ncbi:hypothetical protein DE146DRAFT_216654 [Phaeosphaeria sp. MPI-PUGE-AT-0046c]|nr:hypothetical protein DE146DRAFT_216654 [Phaeosphaeria sp. MPI-PUGE-AT-0046c]
MADLPATMKAWQWSQCIDVLENAIQLNPSAPLPTQKCPLKSGESLVQVYAAALNPVDHKIPELPVVGRMAITKPATPGLDFAGKVVQVGPDCRVNVGQMVFGKLEPKQQFGSLGQYIVGSKAGTVPMPDGITAEQAATIGVCGLVTYQALAPNVKAGDRVFINGGSGGTGTFAVQIAKALGCHVTTTCSDSNAQLCKDLGADEVIDYRTQDVASVLSTSPTPYDLVLDNVGTNFDLYWNSPKFTKPGAKYIQIGSDVSMSTVYDLAFRFLLPKALGGGQRPFSFGMAATNFDHFTEIGKLLAEGKVKPVIDQVYTLEDVPEAYKKLKTGRSKGKLVIRVRVDEKK